MYLPELYPGSTIQFTARGAASDLVMIMITMMMVMIMMVVVKMEYTLEFGAFVTVHPRGGICPSRQCQRQCKIFASSVNFSIFTHFLCFFLLKLLKLGEIDGVKFLA